MVELRWGEDDAATAPSRSLSSLDPCSCEAPESGCDSSKRPGLVRTVAFDTSGSGPDELPSFTIESPQGWKRNVTVCNSFVKQNSIVSSSRVAWGSGCETASTELPDLPHTLTEGRNSSEASPVRIENTLQVPRPPSRGPEESLNTDLRDIFAFQGASASSESTLTPHVVWQWKHRTGWRNYDERVCRRIERAFRRGEPRARLKSGKIGTTPMEIFFREMIQYDPITGNVRAVQRAGGISCLGRLRRRLMLWRRSVETGNSSNLLFEDYQRRRQALFDDIDVPKRGGSILWKAVEDSWCARMLQSNWFGFWSLVLVLANAAWIGIDAEWNDAETLHESEAVYQVAEHIFCGLFLLELIVRFGAFQDIRNAFGDGWLMFDTFLVSLMLVETWVVPPIQEIIGVDAQGSSGMKGFSVLRVARLLRLTRLGRIARLLRMLPEVMTLLKGITTAMRSVFLTLVLLALLLVVFAIVFKNEAANNEVLTELFPTLGASVWNLLLHGVFLDGVSKPLNSIADESYFLSSVYVLFIITSSYTVMNLLIGILCDVVHQVSNHEKDEVAVNYLKTTLLEALECHDKDEDRHIVKDEFELLMTNPEIRLHLTQFGVDVNDLIALKDVLFDSTRKAASREGEMLEHGPDSISFGAFTEVVLGLRGSNSARVKDVVELRDFIQKQLDHLERRVEPLCTLGGRDGERGSIFAPPDRPPSPQPPVVSQVQVKQEDAQVQMLLAELRAGHRAMREELDSIRTTIGDVQQRQAAIISSMAASHPLQKSHSATVPVEIS